MSDKDYDMRFFTYIHKLSTENRSRYEDQARLLINNLGLTFELNGKNFQYKLEPNFCIFELSEDGGKFFQERSSIAINLRSKDLGQELRDFFATTEARIFADFQFKNPI